MTKWPFVVGAAFILGGACTIQEEGFGGCEEVRRDCQVGYSRMSGYHRSCSEVSSPCFGRGGSSRRGGGEGDRDGDRDREGSARADAGSDGRDPAPTGEGSGSDLGPAAPPDMTRYSAFDFPCERDSQCGPGKCIEGDCYYGCQSDAQCGSGDRCAVESGSRICLPDPNPPVVCTRSAQCEAGLICLNGSCRQACEATEDCSNVLDRCGSGVCVPDRRPLGECVLNSECAEGLVCLDGACVAACQEEGDAGVCLAEPPPVLAPPVEGSDAAPEDGASSEEPAAEDEAGEETDEAAEEGAEEASEDDAETTADAGAPDLQLQ